MYISLKRRTNLERSEEIALAMQEYGALVWADIDVACSWIREVQALTDTEIRPVHDKRTMPKKKRN